MARLQILQLPEGPDDERPPFILVIDQATEATIDVLGLRDRQSPTDTIQSLMTVPLAEQLGARAVLCFDETIDIPANDTTAYLPEAEEIHDALSNVAQGISHASSTYRDRRHHPYANGSDHAKATPDFTSPIAGNIEVRQPCPYCPSQPMIPRSLFAAHVAHHHPNQPTPDA